MVLQLCRKFGCFAVCVLLIAGLVIKRGMDALEVIEDHPIRDYAFGVEAVGDFFEINRSLFQRLPKPHDEDVVEKAPPTIHRYSDTSRAQSSFPSLPVNWLP